MTTEAETVDVTQSTQPEHPDVAAAVPQGDGAVLNAQDDGRPWTSYDGSGRPEKLPTIIDVKLRRGEVLLNVKPSDVVWRHWDRLLRNAKPGGDVVAYRAALNVNTTPDSGQAAVDGDEAKIARWIGQAIERADKHGNTEGIWLFAGQWRVVLAALASPTPSDTDSVREAIEAVWKRYEADFNNMTDAEVESERASAQALVDEQEDWLEAVASWEAAGKPRKLTEEAKS